MPKVNVYLPDELAAAVRDAQIPVSAICQAALERAVRDVSALRGSGDTPTEEPAYGPFTRFTPRARSAIAMAQREAKDRHHHCVDTEHLLLGVLEEGSNLALTVLAGLDLEPADVRSELIASFPPPSSDQPDRPPFAPRAKQALELSTKEALGLGHNYVGCEHLLLGLLATDDALASQVLRRMGIELRTTRRAVVTALSGFIRTREQEVPKEQAPTSTLEEILRRLDAIDRRLGA
jgi:ATP-dependent Clp protease ATP-binding subunit ClpC